MFGDNRNGFDRACVAALGGGADVRETQEPTNKRVIKVQPNQIKHSKCTSAGRLRPPECSVRGF